MKLSPDQTIFWQNGFITINLTLVTTWALMLVLVVGAKLITRNLKTGMIISRWQCILEMIVTGINDQIKEVGLNNPREYIGFIGTLFLFIGTANLCIIFPGYTPPTASLSTTTAMALCVFIAVPFFGIQKSGLGGYLKSYLKPTFIMLPFNLISEVSRTLALAVRLFGNVMSGGMIVAILLSISPFIFPVIMNALGLLTGMVQAYIFSILATVYITAAVHDSKKTEKSTLETNNKTNKNG
jgi:F-type H+-transporting ATPase subunit a